MKHKKTVITKGVRCPRCGKTEPDANELAYHMKYECRG